MNFRKSYRFLSIIVISSFILSACNLPGSATPTPVVFVDEIAAEIPLYQVYYLDPAGDDEDTCVDPSHACLTIRSVLDRAPADVTPSIIMAAGVYNEMESPGGYNVWIERDVVLTGAGPGSTIITGENNRIPLYINNRDDETLDVQIRELTVADGNGTVNKWNLYLVRVNLTMENVIVEGATGHGIFSVEFGALNLTNVTVQNNDGGGIVVTGPSDIRDSNIVDNGDTGITNGGRMRIVNSNISRNQGEHIGGIANTRSGELTIINSTIDHNSSNFATHSRTSGIQNQDGAMTIINSTISSNSFGPGASGMAVSNRGPMELIHVTIANNEGIGIADWRGTGHYTNVLIVQNDYRNCDIRPTTYIRLTTGVSLDDDDTCENASTLSGFDTVVDAMIGPLQINRGTSTPTHALLIGSPAIDATDEGCIEDDQTGVSRSSPECDVGAYEFDITEGAEMTSGQSGIPHLTEDELCLSGPGKEWLTHSSLPQGLEVHLVGVGQQPGWLVLSHPQFPDIKCWVPEEHIELPDPQILNGLPTIAIPPKPTPTPTPTKPPVCSPAEQQQGKCTP